MFRKHILCILSLILLLCYSSLTMAQNEKKVLYGVLLDNSGSMRRQFDRVTDLGLGVVRQVHPDGPISIFSFKAIDDPREAPPLALTNSEWSQDKNLLDSHINTLLIEGGQTILFDAIYSIVRQLNKKANTEKDPCLRKVIVLITDGEDRKSGMKANPLLPVLKENNIQVYAIGLVQELDKERRLVGMSSRDAAIKVLTNLSKETGGHAIFPKSNNDEVNVLLRELFALQK